MHLLRNINHCVALLFALTISARQISAPKTCADDSAFRFATKNTGVFVNYRELRLALSWEGLAILGRSLLLLTILLF